MKHSIEDAVSSAIAKANEAVRNSQKKSGENQGSENLESDTVLKVKRFPADFLGLQETIGERS